MTAIFAKRLREQIAKTQDAAQRGELTAHLGLYLARAGEVEAANALCRQLREEFGTARFPRVSILIMCLEAIQTFFRDENRLSEDRIRRANLLSVALNDREMIALTAAWQAFLQFNFDNYESFGASLRQAIDHADASDGAVHLRIAILLAGACQMLMRPEDAGRWYAKARDLAVDLGDQASIGAITYNKAMLGVSGARALKALGRYQAPSFDSLRIEVESAANYQAIAGLRSFDHLLDVIKAGRMMLLDRHADALPVLDRLLSDPGVPLAPEERCVLECDRVVARQSAHPRDEVLALLSRAGYLETLRTADVDDRLIVMSQVHALVPDILQIVPGIGSWAGWEVVREEYLHKMATLESSILGLT